MARTVLAKLLAATNWVALGLVGLLAACGTGPKQVDATGNPAPLVCTGDLSQASADLRKEYAPFKRRVESGPFYIALEQRLGAPRSCSCSVQAKGLRLTYAFPQSGALEAQVDPRIELSQQRVTLRGLEEAEAKSLLQAAETNAFGATGCGIAWDEPVIEQPGTFGGSREAEYRGDACSCQARVLYDGVKVIGLVFRSAC
jgi:hypothetical protein